MKRTLQMAALLAAMAAASGCGSADPGDLIDELRAQSDEVGEAINEARAEIEAAMASISEECPAGWQFDLVTQFDDVNEDSEPARLYRRCRALAQWDLRGRQTWERWSQGADPERIRTALDDVEREIAAVLAEDDSERALYGMTGFHLATPDMHRRIIGDYNLECVEAAKEITMLRGNVGNCPLPTVAREWAGEEHEETLRQGFLLARRGL